MSIAPPVESTRSTAPAKRRVLDAATTLFATEGIRAVGVDRLIQKSSVTKATFYKHFGSKDRVIREYLSGASARTLAELDRAIYADESPRAGLHAVVDTVRATLHRDDFCGSIFINAAAEFFDPHDPVRIIIADHHEAVARRIVELLQRLGHPLPGEAADQVMVAYVGALTWGHVGDPIGAAVAFRRSVERVLDEVPRAH